MSTGFVRTGNFLFASNWFVATTVHRAAGSAGSVAISTRHVHRTPRPEPFITTPPCVSDAVPNRTAGMPLIATFARRARDWSRCNCS